MRNHGRGGVRHGEVSEKLGRERVFLMAVGSSKGEEAEDPNLK